MTCDSQPVTLFADRFSIPASRTNVGTHIVWARFSDFVGLVGYVGTETVNGLPTRQWLKHAIAERSSSPLPDFCRSLAGELTEVWTSYSFDTHLSIFVAGYEHSAPRYWFVSNGEQPDSPSSVIPRTFDAVNDLDDRFRRVNALRGESQAELIARTTPSFRRGVLAAANIFDGYTKLVAKTLAEGHSQFAPIDNLERYAAYTRFRFEFTVRMYEPKKGIAIDNNPPVAGPIHVFSVDPSGTIREHGKELGKCRIHI